MESCPPQAVLPLAGLAANKVIRNRDTYRRSWILLREEQLAGLFTIDIEFHSEMSNHLHVLLRPCLRAAKRLCATEVARRWLTITKLAKCISDELPVLVRLPLSSYEYASSLW